MPANPIDIEVLNALLRYWASKRGAHGMPARHSIDPVEMGARLLPNLMLCDLAERGARARFRLVGTTVVKRLGCDPTGRDLGEAVGGAYGALLAALLRLVYCERAPLYSASAFAWGPARRLELHHLVLPLSQGGPEPTIALVGLAFLSTEAFPPKILALDGIAALSETRRAILASPPLDWPAPARLPSRNVA